MIERKYLTPPIITPSSTDSYVVNWFVQTGRLTTEFLQWKYGVTMKELRDKDVLESLRLDGVNTTEIPIEIQQYLSQNLGSLEDYIAIMRHSEEQEKQLVFEQNND